MINNDAAWLPVTSHGLMSEWLMQCYPLLEDLHGRMIRKVPDSGHVYTDDTTLPLQNDDPTRARNWSVTLPTPDGFTASNIAHVG